jgi:hypothetical protein
VDAITGVTVELSVFPLMTFVWAGLWMMGLGILLVLAGAGVQARAGVPARSEAIGDADALPEASPVTR